MVTQPAGEPYIEEVSCGPGDFLLDANDAELVRELFGYSPEEHAAANARVLDLAERARATGAGDCPPPEDPVYLESWDCHFTKAYIPGFAACSLTAAERAIAYPHLTLAIFLAGEAFCVGAVVVLACSWDRTDPGPPARPK